MHGGAQIQWLRQTILYPTCIDQIQWLQQTRVKRRRRRITCAQERCITGLPSWLLGVRRFLLVTQRKRGLRVRGLG